MLFIGAMVFIEERFCLKDIRIKEGKLVQIEEPGRLCPEPGEQVLKLSGKKILPGLVDIHTHGRVGCDFSFPTREKLEKMCASYASCGVTAVLATVMTNAPHQMENAVECIKEYQRTCGEDKEFLQEEKEGERRKQKGAKLLGIHLEGPFLGKRKKGAHDEQYLRNPDVIWLEQLQRKSGEEIRMITVDPLLEGAESFITDCCRKGMKVSLGHTECDYEQTYLATQAGADHVTHLFNAMSPLHHRNPGLIGAALDFGMYFELIGDGFHLHPSILRLLFAAYPKKALLISDSMPAAGCPDGMYELGGLAVKVTEGKAVQADGTIAGSTISVFEAMVNCIRLGIPEEKAIQSATYLPAKSIGMEHQVGCLAAGRAADVLVVSEEWELEQVYVDGIQVK